MNILPKPQKIEIKEGFLKSKQVNIINLCEDERIEKALSCFGCTSAGAELTIKCSDLVSEKYKLYIEETSILIDAESAAGAFYGIQTLKQIFEYEKVPCLYIEDWPDMKYRGVYHDVTRGKVPTLDRLKKFIDTLAYYKNNSLQLYVEHTFPFKELGDNIEKTGYLTPEEIKELDDYCYENFIEFIPSIATFGHLYELLQRDEFKNLQTAVDFEEDQIFWWKRMRHHTIDPKNERSFEIIKSLIDQYMPLFRSQVFNICCDETFDLTRGKYKEEDTGKLYVDFVKKIVSYVESKGKKVMMWGDILLAHPECIDELPKDIEFLNWYYDPNPDEESFKTFEYAGCKQIVCPGTSSWSRLVENVAVADANIVQMLDLGYKYNADGQLNTNWGDLGNPCSIELAMHGLVLGAAKSWNIKTVPGDEFDAEINAVEYKNDNCVKYLRMLDDAHRNLGWNNLLFCYSNLIYENKFEVTYPEKQEIENAISICKTVMDELSAQSWKKDEYRKEMLLAAEGIVVIAEIYAKLAGYEIKRISNTENWLKNYRRKWLESNKESQLSDIEKIFITLENV